MSKQPPMKLTAHANVVDIGEERRARAEPVIITTVALDGRVVVATLPPGSMVFPNFSSVNLSTLFTLAEIEALQSAEEEEPPRRPWWRRAVLRWARRSRAS